MNKVILLGRLTKDPDVRTTQTGKIVTSFTLAVARFGGQKDEADFISIVAWDKLGENCGNMLSKGQRTLVEGRLQIRSYDGKDGQKRWVTEVIAQSVEFMDRKVAGTGAEGKAPQADAASHFGKDVSPDDEIPF